MYNKQYTIAIQIGLNLFNFRLPQIEVLPVYIRWYGAFGWTNRSWKHQKKALLPLRKDQR